MGRSLMASIAETEELIDKIKMLKGFRSEKEVAALLNLTPSDFSNRKKRGTLTPLILGWAVTDDFLFKHLFHSYAPPEKSVETGSENDLMKNIYRMVNNKSPDEWFSGDPVGKIILSPEISKNTVLIKMAGYSMAPAICDGAIFGVDRDIQVFSSGQIFVVWVPLDGPVVRRAFVDLEKVTLKAENQSYPDISIPKNEVPKNDFILGRVNWVLQRLY